MTEQLFKKFKLSDLFTASTGDTDIKKEHLTSDGVSVVSAGDTMSGVIGKSNIKAKLFEPNTLTVDMFGTTYYRGFEYKLVTHARVFSLKLLPNHGLLNKRTGLYIATAMSFIRKMHGYNSMASWKKIKDYEIYLPATEAGVPDWKYMAEHIRRVEAEHIRRVEAYLKATGFTQDELDNLPDLPPPLPSSSEWEEFKLKDLFRITPSKSYKSIKEHLNGATPVISNTSYNNGIMGYTSLKANNQGNVTTFSDTTDSDKTFFFQDAPFVGYSHVQIMTPRFKNYNREIALYINTCIAKSISGIYDYGAKFNRDNANATLIRLPATAGGALNTNYMEEYVRWVEGHYIRRVIESDLVKQDILKDLAI